MSELGKSVVWMGVAALAGALTWTFLEYVIHRWLGHDKRFRKNPFAVEHIRHHSQGDYFAPTWKKLCAGAAAGLVVAVPAVALAGAARGLAYTAGLLGFYATYEVLHRLEHVTGGVGPYARWARRHHFTHHFVDARFNHGVTTSLWDHVFGTYKAPSTIRVPQRLCMRWLKDERGQVRADWADTFSLGDSPTA